MEDDKNPGSEGSTEQDPTSQQTGDRIGIPQTADPELGNLQTEGINRAPEVKKEEV